MDEDDLGAAVNLEATPYMLESITEALKQNLEPVLPRPNREAATGAVIPINRPAAGAAPGMNAANQPGSQPILPAASAGAGA